MENKENVSDSDSNSSSSWIVINNEPITLREEIEDVELLEDNSDIESESDGISVISESDGINEEKCMEPYDDFIDYKESHYDNCSRFLCAKEPQKDLEDIGVWGMLSYLICGCLCAFVTLQGHEYFKNVNYESQVIDQVIDSTVECVDTFKIHKMHYNKLDVKECVQTVIDDMKYGGSVEEAIKHVNFNKNRTIPLNLEIKNDLGKKCKNFIKKDKCKKKKAIKNNSNKNNKETKNTIATCKLKGKKGNFKKIKNKETVTGEWYLDLHKARNEKRSQEHIGDWVFERANIRNKKRNGALWYFTYMKMREKYRFKSLKKDTL